MAIIHRKMWKKQQSSIGRLEKKWQSSTGRCEKGVIIHRKM